MQNRYAGDVGDFMKLGLLRHLAGPLGAGGAGLSIALNWYLGPDEDHNADGKHISYLLPGNSQHCALRACDPDLMRCLTRVVCNGRSVQALETSGAVPAGSLTHPEMLAPMLGAVRRRSWHRHALEALADAEVVFADPDNGIRAMARGSRLHKFALIDELADYAARGQSLIAYHHAGRSADSRTQARSRLAELARGVGHEPLAAVIARRGSCRFFLITVDERHREHLITSLRSYVSRWVRHVELLWWDAIARIGTRRD